MITVIDSPCGYGKTTYAINMINSNQTGNYIYITPFLSEVNRVVKETMIGKARRFRQPSYNGQNSSKMESFTNMLANNEDIASTHALFARCSKELASLVEVGKYILILDEVMDVLTVVDDIKKDDLMTILKAELAKIDEQTGQLIWLMDDYEGRYDELKDYCDAGSVYVISDTVFVWTFPVELFKAFKDVYICTYMFDSQIQKYYFDFCGLEYQKVSVKDGELVPYEYNKVDMSKVNILLNHKINNIGEGYYDLSKSWYEKHSDIKTLKSNIHNFLRNIAPYMAGIPIKWSKDVLWTTFNKYKEEVEDRRIKKSFLACNVRATNNYIDTFVVIYAVNRFPNPMIINFFKRLGIDMDIDAFALSEMIQFICRSRIRRGESIYCYIPSKRMRELLLDYCK